MATFGYTTIAGTVNANGTGDFRRGSKFTLTETGSVTKITCYIGVTAGTGSSDTRCLIYDVGSGNLLVTSDVVNISGGAATGWFDYNVASPVTLSPADYWILMQDSPPSGTMNTAWQGDAIGTGTFFSKADLFSDGAETTLGTNGTGNPNRTMSIYATYTALTTPTLRVVQSNLRLGG